MWTNAKIIGENQKRITPTLPKGDPARQMSRTELVEFAACPAKWFAKVDEKKSTEAMDFGTVLDVVVTNPDGLDDLIVRPPATYTNSKGVESDWTYHSPVCREWRDEQIEAGRLPVGDEFMERVKLAVKAIKDNPGAASLLACSKKQVLVTADWEDKATGLKIPFSGLLDLVPDVADEQWGKALGDIKTARNGDPAKWPRVCDDQGYDVQGAIYTDIYIAATGEDRTDFTHLVVENTEPFHIPTPMPSLSTEFLMWGRTKYKRAIQLYCQCLKSGQWPSYPVFGMPYKNVQIIGPDGLWTYRTMAGGTRLVAPPEETEENQERFDINN